MMKKKIFYLVYVAVCSIILSSCSKWLEVQPEDRFTEEQIYSNRQGFSDALNGVYLKMAGNSLYGRNLTLSVLDMFAQRYHQSGTTYAAYPYATYRIEDVGVKNTLGSIWDNMYLTIGNLNQFISNVDRYGNILGNSERDEFKGEALGLRAFLYFDLLRMYGPVYNSADSTSLSIPYYNKLTSEISPYLPANEVMNNILSDIRNAEELLASDRVLTEGRTNNHAYRFNILAIKALKARVCLWRGGIQDKQVAYQTAKEVIGYQFAFPWVEHQAITGSTANADRIFSTEVLFNIYTPELYTRYDELFNPLLDQAAILSTGPANQVNNVYEDNQADYRYNYMWTMPGSGVGFKTFIKYADVSDKSLPFRNTIPIIRMTELYYIIAESAADPAEGLAFLNEVRRHRGIAADITETGLLKDEITKEYRKEFFGEGQLWYYYKRNGIRSVMSPNDNAGVYTITLSRFPLPDSETSTR